MKQFYCKKCGSMDVFIKENGSQTGLYCSDCGKWIKWLGKDELRLAELYIDSIRNELSVGEQSKIIELIIPLLKKMPNKDLKDLYFNLL